MTLLLTNADIANVLDPREVVDCLDETYRAYAARTGVTAPRLDLQTPPNARRETYQLGLAAGLSARYGAVRIKSDMTFLQRVQGQKRKEKYCREPGTYFGLVLLFSVANGSLLAILHDGLLQRARVAADSAIGVGHMARENATTLGILGAGGMARAHIDAVRTVRPISRVRIFSPTPENRERLAVHTRATGLDAFAVAAPEYVFEDADIICACTSALGPVVHGPDLSAGQHLTAIGGTLDDAASARVDVALRLGEATHPEEIPDWQLEEECLSFAPAGGKAASGGTRRFAQIPRARRVSLAELLRDPSRGRTAADQITFSERGSLHGLQFAAVGGLVYERACEGGLGLAIAPEHFLQSVRN